MIIQTSAGQRKLQLKARPLWRVLGIYNRFCIGLAPLTGFGKHQNSP